MASKDCNNDAAKKNVVVVKSSDFFTPVQKIHFRQPIQYLDDLPPDNNATFISKVYKPANRIVSCTETSTNFQRSLLKQSQQQNHIVHKIETTPIRRYRRKVSVMDEGLEKTKFVDFARLSTATNFAEMKKTAESETVDVIDLNEEEVMELVNEKYGDAIEAQIKNKIKTYSTTSCFENTPKYQRGIKITRDSSLVPTSVQEYKLREEQFIDKIDKEQSTKDEIKEVQKYLESIIILDSPEKGNKLFTREELKRLPDKIFESPPDIVKKEVSPPKEDHLSDLGGANLNKLDTIQNQQSFGNTIDTTAEIKLEVDDRIWELDLKDIDFNVLTEPTNPGNILSCLDQKKSFPEFPTTGKEIAIAVEDAVIFKEMDKFIAEIKCKNNAQPQENSEEKLSGITTENKENLNNNYCLEYTDINQNNQRVEQNGGVLENTSKSDCLDTEKMQKGKEETETLSILNEIIKTVEIQTQKQEDIKKDNAVVPLKTALFNESVTKNEINLAVKKNDILEKLVLESGIQNKSELEKTTQKVNVATDTCAETLKIVDKTNLSEHKNNNSIQNSSYTKIYDRHNSNEYTLLIIKEDGSLEPININNVASSVKPYDTPADSQFTKISTLENAQNEKSSQINKEELLALIEKVKTAQYDSNLDASKTEQEKLKNFNSSLREHIKIIKKIYEKLEIFTEFTTEKFDGNLLEDQICVLRNDLNFVKSVVEKISVKEETKKLKYKVVSVTKKSSDTQTKIKSPKKLVTKKVIRKRVPRETVVKKFPNNLLRKTLYRTNKLLNIFEKNQAVINNIGENAFVTKLKEIVKNDLKQTQEKNSVEKESDITTIDKEKQNVNEGTSFESNKAAKTNDGNSNTSTLTNSKKSPEELNVHVKKVSPVVLKKSNITEVDIENFNRNLSQEELSSSVSFYSFDQDDEETYEIQKSSADAERNKKTKAKEENFKVQCKENKKRFLRSREISSRYSFRPRATKTNYSSDWYKEALLDKMEKAQSYQVDYMKETPLNIKENQKFNCFLKDDKKPCVVSYDKEPDLNKLIFKKPQSKSLTENFKKVVSEDNIEDKENNVANRYETRSKTVEKKMFESQRTLRSRRV